MKFECFRYVYPHLIFKKIANKKEGFIVKGFAKNATEVVKSAKVVLAPLRFGAGTQNKVLEAMAMGLPAVCTQVGFEGLEIEEGEGVLLGKNPEEFNAKLLALLDSADHRHEVGTKGHQIAKTRFSWDIISNGLLNYLQEAKQS